MTDPEDGRGPAHEPPPFVLLGSGHFVRVGDVVAVFRFQSGYGSRAVREMVGRVRDYHTKTGMGPRVWDVSGHLKRRSAVVLRTGEIVLTWLSTQTVLRRLGR